MFTTSKFKLIILFLIDVITRLFSRPSVALPHPTLGSQCKVSVYLSVYTTEISIPSIYDLINFNMLFDLV